MQVESDGTIDALESLLDRERVAILNGTLEDMSKIAGEKELLVMEHGSLSPDPVTLKRVRQKADRNHHLLAAAVQGVRSVTARLEALQSGHTELNTYDRSGQRTTLGGRHKGALQRRA